MGFNFIHNHLNHLVPQTSTPVMENLENEIVKPVDDGVGPVDAEYVIDGYVPDDVEIAKEITVLEGLIQKSEDAQTQAGYCIEYLGIAKPSKHQTAKFAKSAIITEHLTGAPVMEGVMDGIGKILSAIWKAVKWPFRKIFEMLKKFWGWITKKKSSSVAKAKEGVAATEQEAKKIEEVVANPQAPAATSDNPAEKPTDANPEAAKPAETPTASTPAAKTEAPTATSPAEKDKLYQEAIQRAEKKKLKYIYAGHEKDKNVEASPQDMRDFIDKQPVLFKDYFIDGLAALIPGVDPAKMIKNGSLILGMDEIDIKAKNKAIKSVLAYLQDAFAHMERIQKSNVLEESTMKKLTPYEYLKLMASTLYPGEKDYPSSKDGEVIDEVNTPSGTVKHIRYGGNHGWLSLSIVTHDFDIDKHIRSRMEELNANGISSGGHWEKYGDMFINGDDEGLIKASTANLYFGLIRNFMRGFEVASMALKKNGVPNVLPVKHVPMFGYDPNISKDHITFGVTHPFAREHITSGKTKDESSFFWIFSQYEQSDLPVRDMEKLSQKVNEMVKASSNTDNLTKHVEKDGEVDFEAAKIVAKKLMAANIVKYYNSLVKNILNTMQALVMVHEEHVVLTHDVASSEKRLNDKFDEIRKFNHGKIYKNDLAIYSAQLASGEDVKWVREPNTSNGKFD